MPGTAGPYQEEAQSTDELLHELQDIARQGNTDYLQCFIEALGVELQAAMFTLLLGSRVSAAA